MYSSLPLYHFSPLRYFSTVVGLGLKLFSLVSCSSPMAVSHTAYMNAQISSPSLREYVHGTNAAVQGSAISPISVPRPHSDTKGITRVPQTVLFLVVVGILLILRGNMSMVRKLQHGNLTVNGLSTKWSKFPPLPKIRRFEGP